MAGLVTSSREAFTDHARHELINTAALLGVISSICLVLNVQILEDTLERFI
jgi:hypothetical protein